MSASAQYGARLQSLAETVKQNKAYYSKTTRSVIRTANASMTDTSFDLRRRRNTWELTLSADDESGYGEVSTTLFADVTDEAGLNHLVKEAEDWITMKQAEEERQEQEAKAEEQIRSRRLAALQDEAGVEVRDIYARVSTRLPVELRRLIVEYLVSIKYPDDLVFDHGETVGGTSSVANYVAQMAQTLLPHASSSDHGNLLELAETALLETAVWQLPARFPTKGRPTQLPYALDATTQAQQLRHITLTLSIPDFVHEYYPTALYAAQEHLGQLLQYFPHLRSVYLRFALAERKTSTPRRFRKRGMKVEYTSLNEELIKLLNSFIALDLKQKTFSYTDEARASVHALGPNTAEHFQALVMVWTDAEELVEHAIRLNNAELKVGTMRTED